MTDPATTPTDAPASTPPWGDDFNPERAWSTITSLRDEVRGLKGKVTDAETGARTATETYEATTAELAAVRRELWVARALRAHAVPDELVEYLDGADEAAIMQRAERFAAATARPEPEPEPAAPAPEVDPWEARRRPRAAEATMVPGHAGPDYSPPFIPGHGADEIVAAIRG